MSVIILFLAVIAVIAGWWLSQQRLTAKPWLEEGPVGDFPGTDAMTVPAAKIGLGVFLAVVGSLFALFISAYSMRMSMGDWRALPVPAAAVVQHGRAGPEQRRAAMGARRCAPGRHRGRQRSACSQAERPPSSSWSGSFWPGGS